MLETLREIREINSSFPYPKSLRQWKAQGKKVIGYACTYIPEEIIYAAGMLPVRVIGDSKELALEDANAYLYPTTCSFARACLQLGLEKEFQFLDGFVSGNMCDGMRRLYDIWNYYLPLPFFHQLDVPHKYTERALGFWKNQVLQFKKALEEGFALEISEEALWGAVKVYNTARELLGRLYELRKAEAPPLSGAEVLEVVKASFLIPREEFNRLLEKLLRELTHSGRRVEGKFRLMLSGSPLSNPEFIKAIEDLGGLVVTDDLCTGTRYWMDLVQVDSEGPVEAISRRYLHKGPCARMIPSTVRLERYLRLAKEYRVQGVISQVIRNCAPYAYQQPLLKEKFEGAGIPVLQLDVEYGMPGTGQVRTRVQAFLEMLERGGAA